MHKGKSTMLGRIMAGSQAVIAHHEAGQALFVEYHPPDRHVSQVIVEYCQKVVEATGISLFVIDRAVNSVAMACAFAKQGWGLLCMLDDNEHDGLSSFDATPVGTLDDGTKVYSGPWKVPRPEDPRHFVRVEPAEGKTVVYWGTPKVEETVEATAWPQVYRERNALQEHSFKRLSDHGALNTNYGRKKIVGPDRHQQRAQEKLDKALEGLQQRVDKRVNKVKAQQDKVAESAAKGHGKRLEQRQRTLAVLDKELKDAQHKQGQLAAQAAALGPPGERADRDFRKQTIMTFRTLLLENALTSFITALVTNGVSLLQTRYYVGILQTKFGYGEGHEARRGGLEPMPLDQHIEGRHGERQPRLKICPAPMHDLLEVADHGQHGEHRLHQQAVLPRAARTQCEVGGIALGGMETRIAAG